MMNNQTAPITFGSLFTGIGGLDLGLERAGMQCAWQVEINAYAQNVLRRHWSHLPLYGDITKTDFTQVPRVDVVCGGFPCQPHSSAGKRLASADERDLWHEYLRVIDEVGPRCIIAENVPGLLSSEKGRFFERVLETLAARGFDAEWEILPASAFGAPHRRERVFLVAYARRVHEGRPKRIFERAGHLADYQQPNGLADWNGVQIDRTSRAATVRSACAALACEPLVSRLDDGLPERLGALSGYGNAVVPAVGEFVGRCVMRSLFSR